MFSAAKGVPEKETFFNTIVDLTSYGFTDARSPLMDALIDPLTVSNFTVPDMGMVQQGKTTNNAKQMKAKMPATIPM
jgi:hypothetical protein